TVGNGNSEVNLSAMYHLTNERHLIVSCLANFSRYSEYISVICAFNKTILELTLESTWSIALEKYIDAVLETVEVSNEISGYIARMSFSI
ncbi:6559_t:CDS:1, partial [Rhizophagus irregularis]